jgi:cellobiose phosphorylase
VLSRDQLKLHGAALARTHNVTIKSSCEQLLPKLKENGRILANTCTLLISAVKANLRIAPAGEWLLDNFYLIKEQIHTAIKHLPKGYSQELPRLSNGPSAGLPRVYDIAMEMVTHGDGRVDPGNLNAFIEAYQHVSQLKLGELWAIPIMLRIALIENLSHIAEKLAVDRFDRDLAGSWAEKMTAIAEKDSKNLIMVVADMAHANPSLSSAFVAELVRCLQSRGTPLTMPFTWIEQSLFESGLTIEQLVQSEAQQQAANQLSVSNSIASLRLLGSVDWQDFVEARSYVERILREDPSGVYAGMDFVTRDRYRHVVENISKHSQIEEDEVARLAISMAKAVADKVSSADRSAHVGFYLVDKGLPKLEAQAGSRLPSLEAFLRMSCRFPLFLYLGSVFAVTAITTWFLLAEAIKNGISDFLIGLLGITLVLCASHAAISLINWLVTALVPPRALPRMDFSKGIPVRFRTLVVVPTLLSSAGNVEHLIEALEVRFLANRYENLHFALLTSLLDAAEKTSPEDEALVSLASKRIEELNAKYPSRQNDCFFLFHRPRLWNPQEKIWMGYERKRGILADLNAFLRGDAKDRFSQVVGNIQVLRTVKYVITLDTDTGLPRESARQFVAAMAHPLNYPVYDANEKRVVEGYSILQPQVGVSLPGSSRSLYSAMHESDSGIDPYTRVVSDIYQDVFGEGSFIGKGIYDVDAFDLALKGRFPENRILSHDLIEGGYARAGLLSDLMLYEEYPARYSADVTRRYRWIRGDWQIADWLRRSVPAPGGTTEKNPLSWLSQWKIFDNLRRSLMPLVFTLMLVLAWSVLAPACFWVVLTLAMLVIQPLLASLFDFFRKPKEVLIRQHMLYSLRGCGLNLAQMLLTLVCLPYEAFLSCDAVVRTLWRLNVSHKLTLEWNASGGIDRTTGFLGSLRTMWFAPCFSLAVIAHAITTQPQVPVSAIIIAGIWFVSPVITWWISRPLARKKSALTPEQSIFLRKIARRTWAFFEAFVAPADNWLPPDNYQENRPVALAHRTSPTNMGISLLANLAAHDFGYIATAKLLERTANSLQTMTKMPRHCGHFYNWYDTETLQPLMPLYVSSVDSGNLAAFLITLRSGLRLLKDQPIVNSRVFAGLSDTLDVLKEACTEDFSNSPADFTEISRELAAANVSCPKSVFSVLQSLKKLIILADDLVRVLSGATEGEGICWARAFAQQCQDALADLIYHVPWAELSDGAGKLGDSVNEIPTLSILAKLNEDFLPLTGQPKALMLEAGQRARSTIAAIAAVIEQLDDLANMDYSFLYDKVSHLLAIGYNVGENRRDASLYDLLASEARLATFVAIAQGQLPQSSWFALGRLLSNAGGDPVLLSWNGSMFEYLMPLLVMPNYANTLLDQTYRAVVDRQINYGIQCGVPWGVSESGYNMVDAHINYQYRAFGVPGLGLKRGLAEDLVVAPYASVMALMVKPQAACQNMQRLVELGFSSKYGLFEAIDYTPARQTRGQSGAVISSFMAHHQGMSLLALAYKLLDQPMQKRFASEPIFQATELLLQERVPKDTVYYPHATELDFRQSPDAIEAQMRVFNSPDTQVPQVQLLSNRNYHVMVTGSGGGYSHWQDFAVTRWRADTTRDNFGTFCFIRDMETLEFWSNTSQPALKKPESYEVIFSEGRAEFRRRDNDIDLYTEIAVSSEDDIELRRIVITNRSRKPRKIELTSYAEVVLAPRATDELHPAFSNLFIQTEILHDHRAILCNRRPRSNSEPSMWMFHLMASHGVHHGEVSYETDRMRFIGRGNTLARPQALTETAALSGSSGSVLDPIVAIRHRLILEPGKSAKLDMVTGVCASRNSALSLVEKYQDRRLADRVFELAWTHSQVTLKQLNTTEADAQHFCRLASSIIYSNSSLRAKPGLIIRNTLKQSNLWGYAISGDLPVVLLRIKEVENIELVRQLIQAHTYWRLKGLVVDLFIWNENPASYKQSLNDQIMGLIAAGVEASTMDRPGGIFLRFIEQIPEEDSILLQSIARAIISDSCGGLADQLASTKLVEKAEQSFKPVKTPFPRIKPVAIAPRTDLSFFNGIGGFTPDGKEYVITTAPGQVTPAPWVNILANPHFGSVVSENGLAYTWAANAHEFRLTPWNNDPVCDAAGEALYLRDDERGQFWSPMPLPCRGDAPYTTRHGFGYSVFEHNEYGIHSEVWVYVALDAPVKFSVVKIRNDSGQSRKLSLTGYVEWVLGDLPHKTSAQVITIVDPTCDALFARNSYNAEFASRVAFFDVNESARSYTGDRTEFIGRNGILADPAAMHRPRLSNKVGAALDPCAAIQVPFELTNGQEREIIFMLGAGEDYRSTVDIVRRYRGHAAARQELEVVWNHWAHTLGAVQVETSDKALNLMANGWLIYQTIACRLWARSGFYQSGGAFGFRDQLQDVMALIHTRPDLVRAHILLCAAHQFKEGDVQHWWHPPFGRGVRTLCSDDFLWLAMAVCRYVSSTGDTGVLAEQIDFIDGRPVSKDEDSYYDRPTSAGSPASLYEHCVRAIKMGLRSGEHGLPLIGSGDWNDGMNLVGELGKGESVWLAFFTYDVLLQFSEIARRHADLPFAESCLENAAVLRDNIEKNGWDGNWYRRAYFDDGTPLGSASNDECCIDSISQSWSVLSKAGSPERSAMAMESLDEKLVDRAHGMIRLLHPPLDKSKLNPGYIKGYVPGVRENGGQYTHGAIWATMAFAAAQDHKRAWELLKMINPINHARSLKEISTYKVEPYVVAADVYGLSPHVGRGGWTWYTGSAAWMYRLILESLLGLKLDVDRLRFNPCLPEQGFESCKIHYRHRETVYHITIRQVPNLARTVIVIADGQEQQDNSIPLVDDRQEHHAEVSIIKPPDQT